MMNSDGFTTEVMDAPLDKPREDGEDRTNLIINYLPQSMTDNEMYSMFITCGPLVSCKIMRDKNSGYSFGYGFVQYQNPEDAVKAISQLNGLPVSNKRIKVSYSRPNTADLKNTNLFVNNVPPGASEKEVLSLFEPFGTIITRNILKNSNGTNKGIAFIRYSKKTEAEDAISNLHGHIFPGGTVALEVKVAEDHGKQKAAFYAGFSVGGPESNFDNDYGTAAWAGSGRGRGGGGGGGGRGGHSSAAGSIAASMAASGYGYGFSAMQQGGGNHRGTGQSRFNPISRGGNKGVYPPMRGGGNGGGGGGGWGSGGWGGGFRGGRGGGYGDDNIAWNWTASSGSVNDENSTFFSTEMFPFSPPGGGFLSFPFPFSHPAITDSCSFYSPSSLLPPPPALFSQTPPPLTYLPETSTMGPVSSATGCSSRTPPGGLGGSPQGSLGSTPPLLPINLLGADPGSETNSPSPNSKHQNSGIEGERDGEDLTDDDYNVPPPWHQYISPPTPDILQSISPPFGSPPPPPIGSLPTPSLSPLHRSLPTPSLSPLPLHARSPPPPHNLTNVVSGLSHFFNQTTALQSALFSHQVGGAVSTAASTAEPDLSAAGNNSQEGGVEQLTELSEEFASKLVIGKQADGQAGGFNSALTQTSSSPLALNPFLYQVYCPPFL